MNAANQQYAVRKQDGGWHHIAWGFLKVTGSTVDFDMKLLKIAFKMRTLKLGFYKAMQYALYLVVI